MENRTHNGVKFRILNVIDEFTRECLAVRMGRSLTHQTVIEVLMKLFCERGVPVHLRSDNGSEFTANRVRAWLTSSRCLSGTYKLFRDLLPIPSDRTVPWAIVPRLQLHLVD